MSAVRQKPVLRLKSPKRFLVQRQELKRERLPRTYAATEDDLLCSLVTTWEVVAIAVNNNNGNKNEVRKTLARKYNRQAIDTILHHSKTGRIRDFVINDSDLRPNTREQLTISKIGGTPKQYHKIVDEIFSSAVRRLFEELDLVYYHEHLAGKLRVRLEP